MIIYCGDEDYEYEIPLNDVKQWLKKYFTKMTKKDIYKFMKENEMWFYGAYTCDKEDLIVNLIDLKNDELEDYFEDDLKYEFEDDAYEEYNDWCRYERDEDDFSSRGLSWSMFI